ncbi:MAG: cysteine--tRNA ligase [Candidatus Cloacimonetes bacterium]|jgi:cysteinyl-tRNA synthetase|nr:cysteine--tRNA ligase [Candidatus Cloacimonadota bacterium]
MKIYNTMTRKKENFKPIEEGKVKLYACGPTVYNYFHIGNARAFLFFDVVRRYFEFLGYEMTYVQNITDIEDKLINQAKAEQTTVKKVAQKYIDAFLEDTASLGIKKVNHHPKATEYIGEMIDLIKKLVENNFAYEVDGDVYFSVVNFKNYGKLSGRNIDDLKVGARVKANVQKRHPADFTLWKKAKPEEPSWGSPWGKGRPGWHTECVVMSRSILGETFDIHGGGNDLIFPHHENEIAQAEASSGKPLANYWMHNGYLNIEGEKMSKSLNNFFTARDILKKYDAEAIRFFFLSKHYRSPIDFNEDIIIESSKAVEGFYSILKTVNFLKIENNAPNYSAEMLQLKEKFINAMNDDFNTAKAISVLFEIVKLFKKSNDENFAHLLVELGKSVGFFQNIADHLAEDLGEITENLIELLIEYRNTFKKEKNWEMADKIRNDLQKLNIQLKDTSSGTDWSISK